jgi:hypothetical protein
MDAPASYIFKPPVAARLVADDDAQRHQRRLDLPPGGRTLARQVAAGPVLGHHAFVSFRHPTAPANLPEQREKGLRQWSPKELAANNHGARPSGPAGFWSA